CGTIRHFAIDGILICLSEDGLCTLFDRNSSEAMDQEAKSLADLVVQELRTRILDGRLRLGESLSENTVAADLGISKTPGREGLLRLKMDRLVDVLPQRGSYVFQLSAEEVGMVSELREVLEIAAAAAAMQRNRQELAQRLRVLVQE